MKPIVNFINILSAHFSYESASHSFCICFGKKALSYGKRSHRWWNRHKASVDENIIGFYLNECAQFFKTQITINSVFLNQCAVEFFQVCLQILKYQIKYSIRK